jgi:hypothetical protein
VGDLGVDFEIVEVAYVVACQLSERDLDNNVFGYALICLWEKVRMGVTQLGGLLSVGVAANGAFARGGGE